MSVKYLEIADFHYNPARKAECVSAFNQIIAASCDVDFVVFSGDLFDLPIYANEDLNTLIDLFKQIKKPCCGVCGTQGHEVRSMYRAISRSPLDKNPMPGHLFELHPVNEVNTKGQ